MATLKILATCKDNVKDWVNFRQSRGFTTAEMKQKKGKKDVIASVLGQQTNIEEKAKENRQKKKKKEVYIVLVIH